MTTPDDLVTMAADLGHVDAKITPTESGERWACSCGCGWGQPDRDLRTPVTRSTQREAAQSVMHHLQTAVQRYLSDCLRDGVAPTKIKHRPTVT